MKPYEKPKFFEQIGRTMLARLVERYQPEFTAGNVVLPDTREHQGDPEKSRF